MSGTIIIPGAQRETKAGKKVVELTARCNTLASELHCMRHLVLVLHGFMSDKLKEDPEPDEDEVLIKEMVGWVLDNINATEAFNEDTVLEIMTSLRAAYLEATNQNDD